MSFLPEDYQAPKTSNNYLKLQQGENRIRILTSPVLGWEDWKDDKPVRYHLNNKPAKAEDPKKPIKHFWSFLVYNYNEEQIQIMHVTQSSIRKSIESLCNDKDWGAPFFYDIKIMKTGEKVDTEYAINPVPHKPLEAAIENKFYDKRCNLEALFSNADPFAEWDKYTPLAMDKIRKEAASE